MNWLIEKTYDFRRTLTVQPQKLLWTYNICLQIIWWKIIWWTKYDVKIFGKKSNEPKITQKEISKQLGFSDRTIKRYRVDINMDCPYNRKKYGKKSNKSSSTITQTQTHTTIEKTKKDKNNKKNDLKVGSVLKNDHQDQKTKFVTIIRKMVNNV